MLAQLHSAPNGQLITPQFRRQTIKLWKLDVLCCITITGHTTGISGIAFSPDGSAIICG